MNIENNPVQFSNITLGNEQQLGVNARDVYAWLESKQDFSTWMKKRISQYGYKEGVDYLLHKTVDQLPSGAKYKIDYIVTLNMAKELAMVERTDKGRQVRLYFIEQEKIARNVAQNLQIEIGKAMQYLEQFTNTLSDAGRLLCVGGKQIKPKLLKELDSMIQKVQPSLDFDD